MKLTSKNLVPPGGWYFQQGRYRIEALTFNLLVEAVKSHRGSNGLVEGNVSDEIQNQICTRWPAGCAAASAPVAPERPGFWSSLTSFGNSLLKLGFGKDKLVSQLEADRRAAICAQCHNNSSRTGLGMICSTCTDTSIAAIRSMILGSMRTASDAALKACAICTCDNKLAVWFPLSALKMDDSNRNAYPGFCWRKDAV